MRSRLFVRAGFKFFAGAILGAFAAQILFYRILLVPAWAYGYWDVYLAVEGASAGALITYLVWVLADLKVRLRRSASIAVAANVLVWILFLIVTPTLAASEFDSIQAERNRRDADSGMLIVHHEPVIVAGRMLGTYGADDIAERLLQIMAAAAIQWTAWLTVPWRYGPAHATRQESYIVAAGGFILSTAFWTAFTSAASALFHLLGRRRRAS